MRYAGLTNKVQITLDPRPQPLSVVKNTAVAAALDTVRHRRAPQANVSEPWHMGSCCRAIFYFFFFLSDKRLTSLAVSWQKSPMTDVTQSGRVMDCLHPTLFFFLFLSNTSWVWSYSSKRLKRMEIMKWLTDAQAGSTNDDIQSPSGVAGVIFFQLSHCAANDFPAVSVRVLFFVFLFMPKVSVRVPMFFVVFKEGKAFKWLSKLRVMWETVLILSQ